MTRTRIISQAAIVPSPMAPPSGTTMLTGCAIPFITFTETCATSIAVATTAAARCTACASTRCRIFRISRSVASSPHITAVV